MVPIGDYIGLVFPIIALHPSTAFNPLNTIGTTSMYERIITHIVDCTDAQKGFDLLFTKGTGAVKVMFKF
mgnify:CR=1 FL=1